MRLKNAVAPSPSISNKSQSSEGGVATPAALRASRTAAARAAEAKKLREEALRLQEEQEEKELKTRRKVMEISCIASLSVDTNRLGPALHGSDSKSAMDK